MGIAAPCGMLSAWGELHLTDMEALEELEFKCGTTRRLEMEGTLEVAQTVRSAGVDGAAGRLAFSETTDRA